MTYLYRRSAPSDRDGIASLARAAGSAPPAGEAIVAVAGDDLVAAIAMRDGRVVGGTPDVVSRLRERRLRVLTARHFARAA